MKMNRTTMYALTCVWELAQHPMEWMMAGDIARKHSMPIHYCYKVLELLARASLIESVRGQGFRLIRSLHQISCLELIEACQEGVSEDQIFSLDFANGFKTRVNSVLQELTLQDLVKS